MLKAPRNQTIEILDSELELLNNNIFSLSQNLSIDEITNRVINENIINCLDYLPDNFIDLLILDPPYNLTKNYNGTLFNKMDDNLYISWVEGWLSKLIRCLKPKASIYFCCDWATSLLIAPILKQYFNVKNRITWEREKGRGASKNYKNSLEDIWFCTMAEDYYFNIEAIKLKRRVLAPYKDINNEPKDWQATLDGNYRLTHPSNLWTDISIPFWSMPENTSHPTQKPEKLMAKLILASSSEQDFIFDPFMGSGSSLVVAKKLNRKYCGIELERYYCQLAVKRLMLADDDKTIQGYMDNCFYERNSFPYKK